MQIVVTVIHRDSPRGSDGLVYVLDWETKTVIHQFSPPPAIIEDYPAAGGGGVRGYRGICFVDELCYIASADALYGYDSAWQLKNTVTHPLFTDLHEIAWDGTGFWVTSTGIDAVLKVSIDGELIDSVWFGELGGQTNDQLDIQHRVVDRNVDHRRLHHPMRGEHVAHPNAVQIVGGRPFVTLYYQGAIVALNPIEVIWSDIEYYGSHSGRIAGDRLHLAASFKRSLLTIDRETGVRSSISVIDSVDDTRGGVRKILQEMALWVDARSSLARSMASRVPPWLNPRPQLNRPGWTRGLCLVDAQTVLLGSSPASIYQLNTVSGMIEDHLELSSATQHAVFAVEIDPRPSPEL